jgi:hypothetical protein
MASDASKIKRKRKNRADRHAARPARRSACGGWPKPRMKARRSLLMCDVVVEKPTR